MGCYCPAGTYSDKCENKRCESTIKHILPLFIITIIIKKKLLCFCCVTSLNISEVSLLQLKVSGTAYTSIIYY